MANYISFHHISTLVVETNWLAREHVPKTKGRKIARAHNRNYISFHHSLHPHWWLKLIGLQVNTCQRQKSAK